MTRMIGQRSLNRSLLQFIYSAVPPLVGCPQLLMHYSHTNHPWLEAVCFISTEEESSHQVCVQFHVVLMSSPDLAVALKCLTSPVACRFI
jgi:hypothetical protein